MNLAVELFWCQQKKICGSNPAFFSRGEEKLYMARFLEGF
jgi:hypothetical protein